MVQKAKVVRSSYPQKSKNYKIPGIKPRYYGLVGVLVVALFLILPLPPTWYFDDTGFLIFGLVTLAIFSAIGRLLGRFRRH